MRLVWLLAGMLSLMMVFGTMPAIAQDDTEEADETATEEAAEEEDMTDEEAMKQVLTDVMDGVVSFDQETLEGAIAEDATIVLSYMGVQVLDREKFIQFVKYEDVSSAEFGEPIITRFEDLAFVTVAVEVPGFADGVMFGVVTKSMGEWQLKYCVIDPMSNMLPTSRKEKGEALADTIGDEIVTGFEEKTLEPLTERLSEDHASFIAAIPGLTPLVFSDYEQIVNSIPMAQPLFESLPTPELLESGRIIGNGVLVSWYDFEVPEDVAMRVLVVTLVQGDDGSIINGTVALKGDVMSLMSEAGMAGGAGAPGN